MTSAPIAFAAAGHGEELARADLAQLGLARMSGTLETEDHGACVFEAMRHLLAGDDAARCSLEQQRRVFCAHLQSWVEPLCDAVVANPRADAWLAVAEMTRAFVKAETLTFDMPEA